jgi:hypothetical protein
MVQECWGSALRLNLVHDNLAEHLQPWLLADVGMQEVYGSWMPSFL